MLYHKSATTWCSYFFFLTISCFHVVLSMFLSFLLYVILFDFCFDFDQCFCLHFVFNKFWWKGTSCSCSDICSMIGLNTLNSNSSFYTPANKVLEGNHPACQSVYPWLTLVNSTPYKWTNTVEILHTHSTWLEDLHERG